MHSPLRQNKGITLIELLVALVIAGILIAAIYRTFIGQQKTYTVQEQVVDTQQNVRSGINRMMREIRMAGFGASMVLPGFTVNGQTFNNVVNPDTPVADSLTIVSATGSTTLALAGIPASNMITVNSLTDSQGNTLVDTGDRRYISIGGVESYAITNIAGTTITLGGILTYNHPVNTPVFGIRAIRYQVVDATLLRDENTGAGGQALADNIESFEFKNPDGSIPLNPNSTSMQVTVTARTDRPDPELLKGGGDGYRRRQITSHIHMRNMGL
jgi:prepilin-type N-terminal cleavage/methylation domain-containing protein